MSELMRTLESDGRPQDERWRMIERLALDRAGAMIEGEVSPGVLDWWARQPYEYRERLRKRACLTLYGTEEPPPDPEP